MISFNYVPSLLILLFSFLPLQNSAFARQSRNAQQADQALSSTAQDYQIIQAVERRRNANFIEGAGMVVTKIFPDDTQGLPHQRWNVRLSNGRALLAVSNLDMCRVPIKVGDVVAMGGQFIYSNQGPLLHWLHRDPEARRPDGYVNVNGQVYCK